MADPRTCPASLNRPVLTPVPAIDRWELEAPWDVELPPNKSGRVAVRIPAGFRTDGASIPRYLWSVVGQPMRAAFARAAIVHDFYYRTQTIQRSTADAIFRDMLLEDGVSKARAQVMYRAVQWFGWIPWRKRARK